MNNIEIKKESLNQIEKIVNEVQIHLAEKHKEKFVEIKEQESFEELIAEEIETYCHNKKLQIEGITVEQTINRVKESILSYDILTPLIFDNDNEVEEIRVNDYNDIRIVKAGKEEQLAISFTSREKLFSVAQRLCRNNYAPVIKRDQPYTRLRIGKNIRVSIMASPVVVSNDQRTEKIVQMTIRKQKNKPFSKDELLKNTVNKYGDELISLLIKNGASAAFFGGTNSGKTGTMASYINRMNNKNRTISIAEIDEMNLRQVNDEGNSTNGTLMWEEKKKYNIDFRQLINCSLTFTPDTLVLQEIKSAEAVDVINAAITGHQVVTTVHADNIEVFGKRVLGMFKEANSDLSDDLILEYIADSFDLLIRMVKFKNGIRKIVQVVELKKYNRNTNQFEYNQLLKFKALEITEDDVVGNYESEHFISEGLLEKMVEKGTHNFEIAHLKNLYHQRTET